MEKFILASASPQRKTLLEGLGISFDIVPSTIDETDCSEKEPAKRAMALACMKAEDIAAIHSDAYVIGCDTLVVAADGTLLEKPVDAAEARSMIELQRGSASIVHSGLCVVAPNGKRSDGLSSSSVIFKELSDDEVAWWIGTEQWKGRSGSFQIDGLGQLLIERIEGDWTSIVGLPVFLLEQLFVELGSSMRLY